MREKTIHLILLFFILLTSEIATGQWKDSFKNLYSDSRLFYAFSLSGLMANTDIDGNIQDFYQENIRSCETDDFAKVVKLFGEGMYMFPLYPAAYYIGKYIESDILKQWGKRTLTATFLSAPGLLVSQAILGGARPTNMTGSKWFGAVHKTNGASGHTWVAAIPFIAAAEMTDNLLLRSILYLGSAFTGMSRINDDAHYFSQVFLGYTWAYLGVKSLSRGKINSDSCGVFTDGSRFGFYRKF